MTIQDGYLERDRPLKSLIQWVEVELCASFIRPLWMLKLWVPKQLLGDHAST